MPLADTRIHGTTHERPLDRFLRDELVEVAVGEETVRIFHGTTLVATHARTREPFARVLEPAHVAGLWRVAATAVTPAPPARATFGQSLHAYADAIGGVR